MPYRRLASAVLASWGLRAWRPLAGALWSWHVQVLLCRLCLDSALSYRPKKEPGLLRRRVDCPRASFPDDHQGDVGAVGGATRRRRGFLGAPGARTTGCVMRLDRTLSHLSPYAARGRVLFYGASKSGAGGTMMLRNRRAFRHWRRYGTPPPRGDCRRKKVKENLFVERVCGPEAQSPDQIRIIEVLPPKTPLGVEP